jgi:thiol-disulfide isomerase/thioredoxin
MRTTQKRSTLVIILVIVIVVVGAMLYLLLRPQQPTTSEDTKTSQQTNNEETAEAPESESQPGKYEEYDEEAFAQAEGRRILFFYAPWCPQCRALDASIQEGTVPRGVAIFKTDYDSHQELRQKYGVTMQTTLVEVDENGNEVKKYVAYDDPTFEVVKAAMEL